MRILVLALLAMVLTACGGGGSSDSSTSSSTSSSSYTVTAIDGYLSSAEVYVDRNGDGVAGSDELIGSTDINGQIVLDNVNKAYPIIIRAVAGITRDSDYSGAIAENYEMVSSAGETVVTPFTTLSYLYDIPMDEVLKKLDPDGSLGLDVETISGDYAAINTNKGVVSQALARSMAKALKDEISNNKDSGSQTTNTLDSYVNSIATTLDTQVAAAGNIADDLNETVITIVTNSEGAVIPTTTSTTALDAASSGSGSSGSGSSGSGSSGSGSSSSGSSGSGSSGSGSSGSGSSGSGSSGSGSSGSGSAPTTAPLSITNLRLSVSGEDEFEFRWNDAEGAIYYNLWESIDGIADGTLVGSGIDPSRPGYDDPYYYKTTIADRLNAQYLIQSCNDIGCAASAPILVSDFYVPPVVITEFQLTFSQTKSFDFAWPAIDGATYYKLMENANGNSGFIQVGGNIASDTLAYSHIVSLYNRMNAQYILQSCNDSACNDSKTISVNDNLASSVGYFKPSNTSYSDKFGHSIDLSSDGTTLVIGAPYEKSNTSGINGNQFSDVATRSGAVYIFTLDGSNTWSQQAYIKSSNSERYDYFGYSLDLSEDGSTLAIGAYGEDSNAIGINGYQSNNDEEDSGAVYVFNRDINNNWSQEAYIKPNQPKKGDDFGKTLSLSSDGNTLAVGAPNEDGDATGINGTKSIPSRFIDSGAAYIFSRNASVWSQTAYVKASNSSDVDRFGTIVNISSDGKNLAVSAIGESGISSGINGDQTQSSSALRTGAVYVFTLDEGLTWSQQAYLKSSNPNTYDAFGTDISMSENGNTLAVSAKRESSSAIGVNGNQLDNSTPHSGAVYVFTRDIYNNWAQQAYIKASNPTEYTMFGGSIDLSSDGNTLAVGNRDESSNAIGIGGHQNNSTASFSGAAYIFSRDMNNTWSQKAYIKASNTSVYDNFGTSVKLSSSGQVLAVGASNEGTQATGVNGDQTNNNLNGSGAVYLY